jgi:RNA polymerase sigma-70 factor (ECF subfamily)
VADFEQIFSEYFSALYKYTLALCRNELIAEEIVQETFFKAFKKIDDFRGECKLMVWLCQIAKNTYYSHYAEGKKKCKLSDEADDADVEILLIEKETVFEIHKKLHDLKEPYREVFSLRVLGELTFAQIGELFGKSESWARVTFYRAKTKLREELE